MTRGHNFAICCSPMTRSSTRLRVLDAVRGDLVRPDIRLFHLSVGRRMPARVPLERAPGRDLLPCARAGLPRHHRLGAPYRCAGRKPAAWRSCRVRWLGQLKHAEKYKSRQSSITRSDTCGRCRSAADGAYAGRSWQFSLHHTHLVHNGPTGSDRRIGLGISYIPDCHRASPRFCACWCGAARYGNRFDDDDERRPSRKPVPPNAPFSAEAVARFQAT